MNKIMHAGGDIGTSRVVGLAPVTIPRWWCWGCFSSQAVVSSRGSPWASLVQPAPFASSRTPTRPQDGNSACSERVASSSPFWVPLSWSGDNGPRGVRDSGTFRLGELRLLNEPPDASDDLGVIFVTPPHRRERRSEVGVATSR